MSVDVWQNSDSNLVRHAYTERKRAGMFDGDADYNGALAPAVMELVEVLSKQGHSGSSHAITMAVFNRVTNFDILEDLTSDPDEWMDVAGKPVGHPDAVWQNIRRSLTFSRDGGKTWYDIDDPSRNNGDVWKR